MSLILFHFYLKAKNLVDINVRSKRQTNNSACVCVCALYANFRCYLDHFVTHYYQVMLLCLFGYFIFFCFVFFCRVFLSGLQLPNDFHSQSYVRSKFLCGVVAFFPSSHMYLYLYLYLFDLVGLCPFITM